MDNRKLFSYPAIFTKEDNSFWVEFIDLPGCFSDGRTLEEAMQNAKEALGLFLEELESYPEATMNIKEISLKENQIVSFVSIDLDEHMKKYSEKAVKKTLSIPAWLNTQAEREKINFSQVLKEALILKLNVDKK